MAKKKKKIIRCSKVKGYRPKHYRCKLSRELLKEIEEDPRWILKMEE